MIYGRCALKRKGTGEARQSKNKSRGESLSQLFTANYIKELVSPRSLDGLLYSNYDWLVVY